MDIMFSPYGVGGIPKDALEEIERRTEELLKASSFQEMIEPQKKRKSGRLEETQLLAIPYSATTAGEQPSLSPQTERTYLLSQQQRDLMLKAMKRSITLPSLSLAIPQQPDNPNKRSQPSQWEMEDDEDADGLTPTNAEPAPKQVKFLEDDAMSDQSSICHSPSWETYGQKKKEKKLEAERRKKEKELAEKEAKAAKKQNTSRLSKLPPSSLVTAERSMSDPSLISQHLQKSQLTQRPQDTGRAASTDNLQQSQPYAHSRTELRRTASEGPDLLYQSMSHPPASKPDGKLSRDACPPSASRTPMLRHMSPSGHSRSQETLSAYPSMDPNHKDDYVQYQRAQSCEKAMASLADEELFENSSRHSPRSSSRSRLSSRRSSLTQEAKTAALKLVGIKAAQTSRNDHLACNRSSTHGDYFGFPDHRPTSVGLDPMTSVSGRPHTSHSSLGLGGHPSTDSTSNSQSKKNRSLKEAARSALHLPKGTQPSTNSPKPPASMPPYFALRSRLQSRSSASPESITSHHAPEVNQAAEVGATALASAISTQDTGPGSQTDSRVSEGSSSSSGYGDGSSLPSSASTPDTSRPQSARDVPLGEAESLRGDLKPSSSQDDEQTLRQSMDSSKSSTPRLEDSELHGSPQIGDGDRWSRTSLSIDIDCDAQSFKTSVSNLDDTNEGTPGDSSESHFKTQQQQSYGDKQAKELQTTESWSDAQQYAGESSHAIDDNPPSFTTPVISIPPRSQRRNTVSSTKTSPIEPLQRFAKDATEPLVRYEQVENRSGRPSKPEQANKKQKRQLKLRDPNAGELVGSRETADFSGTTSPGSHHSRSSRSSSSTGSVRLSAGLASPVETSTFSSEYQVPTNPYFEELPVERQVISPTSSLPNSRPQSSSRPSPQPRTQSAPTLPAAAPGAPRTSTPSPTPSTSHRSSKLAPVSILKQSKSQPSDIPSGPPSPGRPPVLSALPKHMQLQAGISVRPPTASPEARLAPIAKMFVECCSCKFYHDMPSKIYECMTKPDAVVEDRALGISGAITTMVKCPWCHHNMSTSCCAGYAAVVYLKEKLH